MKYKPGTKVVITDVPLRAAAVGVCVGMPGVIEPPLEQMSPREVQEFYDMGMTIVKIGNFTFFWREVDLCLPQ